MNRLVFFLTLLFPLLVIAQKRTIDHTVYDQWNTVKATQISEQGVLIAYEVNPHRGDGNLVLHNTVTGKESLFLKGKSGTISTNEKVFAFFISPGFDTLRSLELKKVKKEKWVKDTLGIYFVEEDKLERFPSVKSFQVSKQNTYIAWLSHENTKQFKTVRKCWKRKQEEVKVESKGTELVIFNYGTGDTIRKGNVLDFIFSDDGKWVFYTTQEKQEKQDLVLGCMLQLETKKTVVTYRFSAIGKYAFDEGSTTFAFIASSDTSKNKVFELYQWDLGGLFHRVVDADHADIIKGFGVGNGRAPSFSKDGSRLFFGTQHLPEKEVKDTLLTSEKAALDVWHYQDKQLQPQQLLGAKRELERNFLAVLDVKSKRLIQLENDTLYGQLPKIGNQKHILLSSKEPYEWTYTWEYPWPRDYYAADVSSGDVKKLVSEVTYSMGLSPSGNHFIYFDPKEKHYRLIQVDSGLNYCMTCGTQNTVIWQEDINGQPHDAAPIGIGGFTLNEQAVLLHSKYDIWEFDLIGKGISCLTNGLGEQFNTELRAINRHKDSIYLDKSTLFIHGTDLNTKDERIYQLEESIRRNMLVQWLDTEHKLTGIQFAPSADAVIYQKQNVTDYPNVYVNTTTFDAEKKLSDANPQQKEFRWPTVELIRWKSYRGKELEGLIYKPDDFDPNKSYPMLVYFYELYADRKHVHYIPKPTASIIFATEYTSAGYVVFMPDIRYDPGYPARGAYDCIMSGTDVVLEKYANIDSTRLGLQGQSWGGYQTAQLITMTTRYKAAMAGAPVSNMFSAYGGIRWGSGLNRQFQYERSQSRIGKTIWEAPELYVENSPLFGLPQVQTPLLIMHNDKDGAVPWYQGIELFVGLRRLNKPVWMLNYNEDDHNLMKDANRRDLSIRMRQFFDHYLLDDPAPLWLTEGIPATVKGKEYRLDVPVDGAYENKNSSSSF